MPTRADSLLARLVPLAPRPIVAGIAARYIAGDDLASALAVATALHGRGARATLDILGEAVTDEREADVFADGYVEALDRLVGAGLEPHVSIKPTALGSELDWDACGRRVRRIMDAATAVGGTVNLDMEDATTTDGTIALYRELRAEGHDNLAIVLQARLHRTRADVAALAPLAPHVRLCKGIYRESPAIAYVDDADIRASWLECLDVLLDAGSYVAIATHADVLVRGALEALERRGRTPASYEFQTLLGVREELVARLVSEGRTVRVYVPYGPQWYDYAMRRMRESPQVAGHVARAVVSRAIERIHHPARRPS
jgi:proline dehydrogenase